MRVRSLSLALAMLGGLAAGGCTELRSHQGYVIDPDLVNSVQPGVDTRESVRKTLGEPSFTSQFGAGDFYYIARNSKNYAFNKPKAQDQITIDISFDAAGTVKAVRRSGTEQVAAVDMYGKVTPTLGRKRSLFQDLFGNIGTVGAAGVGGGDSGGGGGGGRSQP